MGAASPSPSPPVSPSGAEGPSPSSSPFDAASTQAFGAASPSPSSSSSALGAASPWPSRSGAVSPSPSTLGPAASPFGLAASPSSAAWGAASPSSSSSPAPSSGAASPSRSTFGPASPSALGASSPSPSPFGPAASPSSSSSGAASSSGAPSPWSASALGAASSSPSPSTFVPAAWSSSSASAAASPSPIAAVAAPPPSFGRAMSVVVVLALSSFSSSCGQPAPRCFTSIGSYAATYALREGTGPCAELAGDVLGVASYNPRGADGRPDLTRADVAIGTRRLGLLADRAAAAGFVDDGDGRRRYAIGSFAAMEPVDDLCTTTAMEPARQSLPAVPASDAGPAQDAVDAVNAWSDLQFYVTAGTRGQQLRGTLTIEEGDCAATYDVRAVFPAIDCTSFRDDGAPYADDRWCDPAASAFNGGVGSGIPPEFPTTCDPNLLLCVLQGDGFPVLAPAP